MFGHDGAVVRFTLVYRVVRGGTSCVRLFDFWNKVLSCVAVWMESLIPQAHQITHKAHGSSTLSTKDRTDHAFT
jgi:hypothetical protein